MLKKEERGIQPTGTQHPSGYFEEQATSIMIDGHPACPRIEPPHGTYVLRGLKHGVEVGFYTLVFLVRSISHFLLTFP